MKKVQGLFKLLSDYLKTLMQRVDALANKFKERAKTETANNTIRKANKKKKVKPLTATETVFGVISRSKKGVNTATIVEMTGFNRKQVANYILKLKKQGKIKIVQRGVYKKS
jgi:hypothetical protein